MTYLGFPLAEVGDFFQDLQHDKVDTDYLLERLGKKEKDIQEQLERLGHLRQELIQLIQNTGDLLNVLEDVGKFLQ